MSDLLDPSGPSPGAGITNFEELVHSIDGIVWEADAANFQFTFVSDRAEAILGFPVQEWYQVTDFWANRIHPEDREQAVNFCISATARGEDHQFEYRMVRADGQSIWIRDVVSLVTIPSGKKYLRGVMLDVTAQKIAEEALAFSEERFRQLAENIREVFWVHAPNDNSMVYVSPGFERVWGRTCESMYKDRFSFYETIFPEDKERTENIIKAGADTGFEVEYRIVRPDGSIRWIRDRGFPVNDANGNVYRLAGIAEDITDRKRLEEGLFRSQKLEAVGQLAGGIAHDFNNLLTAIIGYSDLALRKLRADDPVVRHLEEIRSSGNRAAELTKQLLAFSRRQIMRPTVIDLNTVTSEIEPMLERLVGDKIDVYVRCADHIDTVHADRGQIEQVMVNLTLNARDAMPNGGTLRIGTAEQTMDECLAAELDLHAAGKYACLSFEDTGKGVDSGDLEHIFEPFFTTKEIGKGTGLGLSTVYGVIRQSGGSVSVESTPGEGSTFKIFLPCFPDELEDQPSESDHEDLP